jgi:hypothetical protein
LPYNVSMIDLATFEPRTFPLEPWWFVRPHTIHGLTHTRRVLIHALALAQPAELDPVELEALVYAAAWHDIGRTHDDVDPDHGRKSLARIVDLNLACDLAPEVLEPLFFAIEWHATDDALAVQAAPATPPRVVAPGAHAPEGAPQHEAAPGADLGAHAPVRDPRLRVLWTLKDADGLDRVRIYDLDVTRLRSGAARDREAEARRLYEEMG